MKLHEIVTDTPIIIDLIRQRLEKGEKVILDVVLPVDSGVDIGSGPKSDKPEKCQGTIFLAHDAREYGGDGRKYPQDKLFIELEYTEKYKSMSGPNRGKQHNSIIALWADWVEEHLKLSRDGKGWKVHV
jgi:hypothetical protein